MGKERYKYASAPYNFIPLPEKIVYRRSIFEEKENDIDEFKSEYNIKKLPTHDKFDKILKTGYIDYTITSMTPLFVGNGKGQFFNVKGRYDIPGGTVRGKVRSNAEILSWSNPEFIKDSRLWYRGAFSSDVLKKLYKNFLLPNENSKINDNVKAGYLVNECGQYKIIPAKEDRYHKSFRDIHEKYLAKQGKIGKLDNEINFMYTLEYKESRSDNLINSWNKFDELKDNKELLKEQLKNVIGDKKEEELDQDQKQVKNNLEEEIGNINTKIKNLLEDNENSNYKPYYCSVLYDINDENEIRIKSTEKFNKSKCFGVLMNSDKMKKNNKQNHYLIFSPDLDKGKIVISKNLKDNFQTSVKIRQREISRLFHLPKEKECIPVFYVMNPADNAIESFGFTPYLKIPYEKPVCDGIDTKREYANIFLDYVQSIFGFTDFEYKYDKENKSISYKGRVSFTNARLIENEDIKFENEIKKSLMSPKISSFQLYLNQDKIEDYKYNLSKYKNNLKTYAGDFKLRGYKFYWLKNECDCNDDYEKAKGKNNGKRKISKEQFANLKSVKSGSKFKGKVYFENLAEDELGLLIMSIKPFDGAMDNLGQGKPYGFGKVQFDIDGIYEINIEDIFKKFNVSKEDYLKLTDQKIETYKKEFKGFMKRQDIELDPMQNSRLKCFYMSKHKEQKIKDREFSYMDFKYEKTMFINRNVLKSMENYADEICQNEITSFNCTKNENYTDLENILGSKFKVSKRKNY